MRPAARPTLLCLLSLLDGFETAVEKRQAKAGNIEDMPPLGCLNHPLTRHCVDQFGHTDAEIKHETISSAKGVLLYKAKSARWRGAVHIDPSTQQPWIVDAGLRRDGDPDDFYAAFAAKDHRSLLPTDDDRKLLRIEQAAQHFRIKHSRQTINDGVGH